MKRATRTREGYHWFRGWRTPSTAQRRVLDELVTGGTNAEIAQRLGMSEDGVKWHLSELRQELEIDDRRKLAEWWRERRDRAGIFFPLGALGRVFANHAAAVVAAAAVVSAAIAWLAYAGLDGSGSGGATTRQPASAAPSVAPAVIVPTPTATPVPPTALVFDVENGNASVLPGTLAGRRWLDPDAGTFVGYGPTGLTVIASDGTTRPVPGGRGFADYQPIPGTARVVVWHSDVGALVEADVDAGTERVLAEFGGDPTSRRRFALSVAGRRIVLTDPTASEARSYPFDGGPELLVYRAPPGLGIMHAAWSPDGAKLLLLLARRGAQDRLEPADRFVVVDSTGRQLLGREGTTARWAGNAWLLITPAGQQLSGGPGEASFLSVPGGIESPAGPASSWMCVSPDGRYGIVVSEAPGSGNSRSEYRHELRDLRDGSTVTEVRSPQWLVSCDWTPDSRKAVLSPGGK
jgi:DNA-binding CsgD family transcriptional regulator